MIYIGIPNNNIAEREYIIKVIFSEFLGLEYVLKICESDFNYQISFAQSVLLVRDHFFGAFEKDNSYLQASAIPNRVVYSENQFTLEQNVPVIFGNEEFEVTKNSILCGIDIFASSFFMLTRWEEYVKTIRDEHKRFPGTNSLACKFNFLDRPIVNEYVEMLWNMLKHLGYLGKRRIRDFNLVLTHDIDAIRYVSFRTVLGDILKRKNFILATKSFKYLLRQDPFDTYDYLMSSSERIGLKSHFYFMSTDTNAMYDTSDYIKSMKFKSVIKLIKDRGHIIGFHPGYYTYNNPNRWRYEKERLEDAAKTEITEGRQHFLRLDIAETFSIWEENNMEIDSTLGYAELEGFRCGTGDLFTVFNFIRRRQLQLKERPLIIMDGTLRQYQGYNPEQVLEKAQYYFALGKKYKTGITLLFHNSSFFGEWAGYDSIYREILNI